MPAFHAFDGTKLAYHIQGEGAPLVCVPGGPMRDSVYLGDLGGLAAVRRLIMVDLRGTGQSAVPADPASYRCDRLVNDVAALQEDLGLERIDVLAHSAGANIVVQYAARHPLRVGKLVLVTPSTRAVGLAASSEMRREIVNLRRGEPWFADAAAAFERIQAGSDADEDWDAIVPFFYGAATPRPGPTPPRMKSRSTSRRPACSAGRARSTRRPPARRSPRCPRPCWCSPVRRTRTPFR